MTYVTCALTAYGGWGDEFLARHIKPEYARRLKEEKKSGGLGWRTQAWKQGLFENMYVHRHRSRGPTTRCSLLAPYPPLAA